MLQFFLEAFVFLAFRQIACNCCFHRLEVSGMQTLLAFSRDCNVPLALSSLCGFCGCCIASSADGRMDRFLYTIFLCALRTSRKNVLLISGPASISGSEVKPSLHALRRLRPSVSDGYNILLDIFEQRLTNGFSENSSTAARHYAALYPLAMSPVLHSAGRRPRMYGCTLESLLSCQR